MPRGWLKYGMTPVVCLLAVAGGTPLGCKPAKDKPKAADPFEQVYGRLLGQAPGSPSELCAGAKLGATVDLAAFKKHRGNLPTGLKWPDGERIGCKVDLRGGRVATMAVGRTSYRALSRYIAKRWGPPAATVDRPQGTKRRIWLNAAKRVRAVIDDRPGEEIYHPPMYFQRYVTVEDLLADSPRGMGLASGDPILGKPTRALADGLPSWASGISREGVVGFPPLGLCPEIADTRAENWLSLARDKAGTIEGYVLKLRWLAAGEKATVLKLLEAKHGEPVAEGTDRIFRTKTTSVRVKEDVDSGLFIAFSRARKP